MTSGSGAALPPAQHHILLALLPGERHGYAVMKDVEAMTHGAIRLGPGTLYGAIKRLLESGLVEEAGERQAEGDERRRYYRITSSGRRVLAQETARLQRLVAFAHDHLRGAHA
ncbi:MAG TPA: PadR family transcriptional regulator [Luteimonas sp.]|nr:PadR family transcriptional regulator [Luteimonas sp.]